MDVRFRDLETKIQDSSFKKDDSQYDSEIQRIDLKRVLKHPTQTLGLTQNVKDLYEKAMASIEQKEYESAKATLHQVISQNPKPELLIKSNYWLGEIFLVEKSYEEAAIYFGQASTYILQQEHKDVIQKGPEIFLKLAQSLVFLDRREDALITLSKVEEAFDHIPDNIKIQADLLKDTLQKE